MPQRQSSRAPLHLKTTSSSDSDPLHHRPTTDRSPKVGERRSPRSAQSDVLNQKKLGTRIADLETQLGQAHVDLKNLKEQLASAEAAKKEAQEELEKKVKKPVENEENHPPSNEDTSPDEDVPDDYQKETDVFEVPMENTLVEPKVEHNQEESETKSIEINSVEPPTSLELEKPSFEEFAQKNDEINSLNANLEEKHKEVEVLVQENSSLKKQLTGASFELSSARAREDETTLKLLQVGEELESSKLNATRLSEKLESMEADKEALEAEMKKLRVQTEQWRKAADAAAAVLAGEVDMSGGRISERCGSMDKHFGGIFEPPAGGYTGFVGSPGMGYDMDDGYGNGKKKGSGIKMFGDLWRKKGSK